MRKTIQGKVYDHALDCCHLVVVDEDLDVLHDALREFEGKKVRITIEAIFTLSRRKKT